MGRTFTEHPLFVQRCSDVAVESKQNLVLTESFRGGVKSSKQKHSDSDTVKANIEKQRDGGEGYHLRLFNRSEIHFTGILKKQEHVIGGRVVRPEEITIVKAPNGDFRCELLRDQGGVYRSHYRVRMQSGCSSADLSLQ